MIKNINTQQIEKIIFNYLFKKNSNEIRNFKILKNKLRTQFESYAKIIARSNKVQNNVIITNDCENQQEIINLIFLLFKVIIQFQQSKFFNFFYNFFNFLY